jgi:inorganic pyrophosphatase
MSDSYKLHCLVEIPKGSRNKYEWDPELKAIKLDRFLFSSVVYPTDYGFIPDTWAADGDPLDAMVCVSEPTFPGCVIPVKVIALFRMRDDKREEALAVIEESRRRFAAMGADAPPIPPDA